MKNLARGPQWGDAYLRSQQCPRNKKGRKEEAEAMLEEGLPELGTAAYERSRVKFQKHLVPQHCWEWPNHIQGGTWTRQAQALQPSSNTCCVTLVHLVTSLSSFSL